jgi:hypothetical protein
VGEEAEEEDEAEEGAGGEGESESEREFGRTRATFAERKRVTSSRSRQITLNDDYDPDYDCK